MSVVRAVSDGILKHQLEGFQGYPKGRDERFLEVFNEQCVSVDHARAVVLEFRVKMPTLQDIIDTALNIRPRFEVVPSQREEWERQYGKPVPFDIPAGLASLAPQGREIDRLWSEVLAFFKTNNFDGKGDIQLLHWGRCWQVARALGYEMNSAQLADMAAYEHANPKSRENLPVKRAPITEQDFKALAAGDDPGRWE